MAIGNEVVTAGSVQAERQAVIELLRRATKLIVVTHEHPDGDALGSLVAMRGLLSSLGKDCLMFIGADELPLPYEYGTLVLDGLVSEAPADVADRTVVFLDCGSIERNPAANALRPSEGWTEIINVDHHHDNTRFGTANYVDSSSSCTAEMVWDLLHALGGGLSEQIAEALYMGLITDTGCFMYENTGPRAHLMAAELIEAGVDVHGTYQRVYEGVPFERLMLLQRGLARAERHGAGRLTIAQLSAEDFRSAGAEESYSEGVVDHLRAVRGTAVAALVRDRLQGDGEAVLDSQGARIRKVSLRAADRRVDVSAIARAQGGGGHRAAAGFSTTLPWEELVEFLARALDDQLGTQ